MTDAVTLELSPIAASQRAVIEGLRSVGHLAVPAMVHWAVSRAVYLYIATFGMNVRFCRDEGCPDHERSSGMSAVWRGSR